jgi:uncharacterized protein (TIGR02145 family)
MKKRNQFIHLLFIAVLIFASIVTSGKSSGKLKDADGNEYKTVKIGSQVWMAENLKTTKYNDGTEIANVTSDKQWGELKTGAYCNYEKKESNAATYGRLYNWYAINTGKLAPAGWHVPTDEDWTVLKDYLIANGFNYDGKKKNNEIAKSLASTTGWDLAIEWAPGGSPQKNNRSKFTALPGGVRSSSGMFNFIGKQAYWWSSTEYDKISAYYRALNYDSSKFERFGRYNEFGLSVRLVKD